MKLKIENANAEKTVLLCDEFSNTTLPEHGGEKDNGRVFTINECMEQLGFGWFQIKLTIHLGFFWIADAIAISTLALLTPIWECYWNLTPEKTAIISTCLFIGMFFGAWFWGWVSDVFGRKMALLLSLSIVVFSTMCGAASPNYRFILASMVIQGFGVSGAGQSMPLLFEMLPAEKKGLGNTLIGILYVFGNIISAILAVLVMNSLGWRVFMVLTCTPIFTILLTLWWLPESPRFLLGIGKKDKSMQVLRRIAKDNNKKMPTGDLKGIPCYQRKPRGRVVDLLTTEYRRTTLLLWMLWFTSIFCYYGILLCTTVLLNKRDMTCARSDETEEHQIHPLLNHVKPYQLHQNTTNESSCHKMETSTYIGFLFTALGEIPGMILSLVLADKYGRKPALAILFTISALTISLLHMCLEKIPLVIIIFLLRAFITGLVQTVYLYTPEVYPTNIRAIGFGTASSMARVGAILTPFVSQVMIETLPHVAILTYSILMVLCIVASLLLPVETKGMKLLESDDVEN